MTTGQEPQNISLIVEVKRPGYLDSNQNFLQLITYMIIERRKAGKQSAAVYGCLSNFNYFRFFKIEHDGSIRKTVLFDEMREPGVILAWPAKIFGAAQASSPSTISPTETATVVQTTLHKIADLSEPFPQDEEDDLQDLRDKIEEFVAEHGIGEA
ncbi:hypothetical protein HKX48_009582 [Thoreauomyces humboldtii]|nr:hypothetical protein HKX48_009582 [Thoreauomyces humboldtii]